MGATKSVSLVEALVGLSENRYFNLMEDVNG